MENTKKMAEDNLHTKVDLENGSPAFVKPVLQAVRVLNLYACLGGNRYKWDEVANIEVTAVELDPDLARMYQERFRMIK